MFGHVNTSEPSELWVALQGVCFVAVVLAAKHLAYKLTCMCSSRTDCLCIVAETTCVNLLQGVVHRGKWAPKTSKA